MSHNSSPHESDIRFLWRILGPYQRTGLAVLGLVLLDTALASLGVGIVLPIFQMLLDPEFQSTMFGRLFPFMEAISPVDRLVLVSGATVLLYFLKGIIATATTYRSNDFLLRLRFYWVKRIGEAYLFGRMEDLAGKKQGALVNNWYNETLAASRYFQSTLAYFSSGALALTLAILGFLVNWKGMVILMAMGGVLVVLLQRPLYSKAAGLSKVKLETNQAIIANMAESLVNLREIKLLQAESSRLGQLDKMCLRLKGVLVRGAIMAEIPRIVGEFLTVLALMSFLVIGVVWYDQHPNEVLPLVAFFFVAFYRLVGAVIQVMSSRVKSLNELHSIHVIHDLIQPKIDRENHPVAGKHLDRITTDITIEDLWYSHKKGVPTLASINTVIPVGKTTLILGASGSGKSTLLDLLFRFIEPERGSINANGRKIVEYSLLDWRSMFGYVSQETALFNGTILMNLKIARPEADDAEIQRVCQLVGADEFIRSFPQGYETIVGDRGHTISGGQRKRIAIARALLRQPSILILDEATAAIEQSLEQSMLLTLRKELPHLTLVIVTHRPQSLPNIDWVIVLDQGKIVRSAPWSELQDLIQALVPQNIEETSIQ